MLSFSKRLKENFLKKVQKKFGDKKKQLILQSQNKREKF